MHFSDFFRCAGANLAKQALLATAHNIQIKKVAVLLGFYIPASWAANWSHCSLYAATNQRAVTKLSAKSKNFLNSPSRRSTEATPPGFHRPSNRRHATKQNAKLHSRHAPHRRLVQRLRSVLTVQKPKKATP
ncbi:hypothetical protein TNCV_689791 [Trichonephila clavipes]|nr:hypothetical protein TNCV_689791 [Trichonephila clavipes]